MAPVTGLCKLCEKVQAKYKCPICSLPYCSLVCYKPHKTEHEEALAKAAEEAAEEEELASNAGGGTADSTATAGAETTAAGEEQQSETQQAQGANASEEASSTTTSTAAVNAPFIPDYSLLLDSEPFISAISKAGPLRDNLLAIHKSTLKSTFDEQNRKLMMQQQQGGSFSFRGSNRGRGGKHRGGYPQKWTPERGAGRGLKMLSNLRTGGVNENAEVEEFAQETINLLKMYEGEKEQT